MPETKAITRKSEPDTVFDGIDPALKYKILEYLPSSILFEEIRKASRSLNSLATNILFKRHDKLARSCQEQLVSMWLNDIQKAKDRAPTKSKPTEIKVNPLTISRCLTHDSIFEQVSYIRSALTSERSAAKRKSLGVKVYWFNLLRPSLEDPNSSIAHKINCLRMLELTSPPMDKHSKIEINKSYRAIIDALFTKLDDADIAVRLTARQALVTLPINMLSYEQCEKLTASLTSSLRQDSPSRRNYKENQKALTILVHKLSHERFHKLLDSSISNILKLGSGSRQAFLVLMAVAPKLSKEQWTKFLSPITNALNKKPWWVQIGAEVTGMAILTSLAKGYYDTTGATSVFGSLAYLAVLMVRSPYSPKKNLNTSTLNTWHS